jgi:anti-sigma factor RsiW
MVKRDPLKEIMGSPLEPIPYSSHPSDAVLRDYIQGRLSQSSSLDVAALQAGRLSTWHRAEVTAHLLTCTRCAQVVRQLRAEPSPHRLQAFFEKLWPKRAPVPMFARVIMLAQFVIILCLAGVIYFKPASFFSALSPTASVPPSSEITKSLRSKRRRRHTRNRWWSSHQTIRW